MTDSVESVLQKLAEEIVVWFVQIDDPTRKRSLAHVQELLRSALEPMLAERNMKDGECHICKTQTELIAGEPGMWPMWLGYYGGNGKTRPYHRGCVIKALHDHEAATIPQRGKG